MTSSAQNPTAFPEALKDPMWQDLEEAILLGDALALFALLPQMEEWRDCPESLRRDVEALAYFRDHYHGKTHGALDRQIKESDANWSARLLERIRDI